MTPVEWSAVLALVGGAVDLAIRVVDALRAENCPVTGCPADVLARLAPADIPAEGQAMFAARGRAEARVRGLDRASIHELRARDSDEVLARLGKLPSLQPEARSHSKGSGPAAEHTDADEVYGLDDGDTERPPPDAA